MEESSVFIWKIIEPIGVVDNGIDRINLKSTTVATRMDGWGQGKIFSVV
jgi:hypothetical protein